MKRKYNLTFDFFKTEKECINYIDQFKNKNKNNKYLLKLNKNIKPLKHIFSDKTTCFILWYRY